MKTGIQLLVGLAVLLTVGCAHKVSYRLADQGRVSGPVLEKSLAVVTFADGTTPESAREFQEGEYKWRVNSRDRYRDKEIANGVSEMIANHLRHAGLFEQVVRNSAGKPADYELTGTITQYYSRGRINKGAEATVITGAMVGSLIGVGLTMSATAGEKTEIHAGAELRDVSLREVASGQVLWSDTINVSTNFTAHWMQADKDHIHDHPDACLKQAVTELIRRLSVVLLGKAEAKAVGNGDGARTTTHGRGDNR